ncbi:tRNA (adenosine(37)-N6)-threonylcarbamoyltransferase complex ATPase subunit type 1 TsaE [Thermodesulforhabdus norvegica]|uniref:tRNA threonylcarbamoyladenosine biosynthesis protein TsaE n=1 Tax=Thermodesulforhabdus norvegica TaxID=39841 RepID=A0A1I4QMW9_9BACT|nr:tRNA (adenosine(37)-N6)-threonylcarbamoyltransferase complex ATPase subunit type 1 TsaE [Thermodesulforhabdus norvegica]SFM41462.1 tRNA threonylcarbamoyladenosine biosynthesis protein TsaE [Thermodesulforhabdus norvegica]
MERLIRLTCSSEETVDLGRSIGKMLRPGDVLALWGSLGAGKTTFTRGVARGIGIPEDIPITSPTFTLINEYEGPLKLYHIDLYRVASEDDLETLPLREILYGAGVSVIEWPEKIGGYLPHCRWDVRFEIVDDERRRITVERVEDSR